MTDAGGLVAWLREQIQADRQLALAAGGDGSGKWAASRNDGMFLHHDGPHLKTGDGDDWIKQINIGVWLCDDPADDCEYMRGRWMEQARHAERWDPEAVLADLDAKLRIVEMCESTLWEHEGGPDVVADVALRLLAAPYAGRLGWSGTWRVA